MGPESSWLGLAVRGPKNFGRFFFGFFLRPVEVGVLSVSQIAVRLVYNGGSVVEDTWKVAEIAGASGEMPLWSALVGRVYSGSDGETIRIKFRVVVDGDNTTSGPYLELSVREAEKFSAVLARCNDGDFYSEKIGNVEVRLAGQKFMSGMSATEMLRVEFPVYVDGRGRQAVILAGVRGLFHAVQDVLYGDRG